MRSDIVVIGGGVIGTSIAYFLAKDGLHVTLLEKGSIANPGAASRASAGGLRENNRDPREIPLAQASLAYWASFEDELGMDLEYSPNGQMMLYNEEIARNEIEKDLEEHQKLGISARILDRYEISQLVPAVSKKFTYAMYHPNGGQASALLATIALANTAKKWGAAICRGVEVYSIRRQGDRVIGVETSKGFIACGAVVNCAGAWSPLLHETLGLAMQRLPFTTRLPQMSATLPAPPNMLGPVISVKGRKLSLKQTMDGRLLAGGGYPSDPGPAAYSAVFSEESLLKQRAEVITVLPHAETIPVDYTFYGAEASCVDDVPIIGPVPDVKGYFLASGFSGHGFTLAPGVGRVIADYVQGKPPSIQVDELGYSRTFQQSVNKRSEVRSDPG